MMVPSEITKALKDPRATQIAGLWHKIIKTVLLLDRKKKKKNNLPEPQSISFTSLLKIYLMFQASCSY